MIPTNSAQEFLVVENVKRIPIVTLMENVFATIVSLVIHTGDVQPNLAVEDVVLTPFVTPIQIAVDVNLVSLVIH